jgi:hypothetical protein
VLDKGAIANPLLFETIIFVNKELFPSGMVTLGGLNVNSSRAITILIEFNLDDSLRIKSFNYITLLSTVDAVWLNGNSNMLVLFGLGIIIVHYIIRVVDVFRNSPLFGEFIFLNIFLDIVPDGSWLDAFKVNFSGNDIIKRLVCETILSNQMQ